MSIPCHLAILPDCYVCVWMYGCWHLVRVCVFLWHKCSVQLYSKFEYYLHRYQRLQFTIRMSLLLGRRALVSNAFCILALRF